MPTTRTTPLRRAGLVAALAAAGVLTAAGAASAHVTVHPDNYAKGATDGALTFRVPDEEDTAATTEFRLFLPTDHPVLGVLVSPHDGWTAKVTNTRLRTPVKTDDGTITEAVSEITWTGGKIDAGRYEDFDVAFGRLPDDTGRLTFKALQTYSDGKTVRWIETAGPGAPEPENPAPVLTLGAAAANRAGGDSTDTKAAAVTGKNSRNAAATTPAADPTTRTLAVAALIAGLLGLTAGAFAALRVRTAGSRPK
ncbi:YcnI family protein [Streptomyces sp. NPDC006172]|uniref:YcnI family protein n=1 Tax=Streptomyces sp. NPDC006172 TaxID=3154470 RepID=UPI0033EAA255